MYSLHEQVKALEVLLAQLSSEPFFSTSKDKEISSEDILPIELHRKVQAQPLYVHHFPVFQFSVEGLLPTFDKNDTAHQREMLHYYANKAVHAYNAQQSNVKFDSAVIIVCQYFRHKYSRSLNRRNVRLLQRAVHYTSLTPEDDWRSMWYMNIGFFDEELDHVQIYVVSRKNFTTFYEYLMDYHNELKMVQHLKGEREKYVEAYHQTLKKEQKRKEEEKKRRQQDPDYLEFWF